MLPQTTTKAEHVRRSPLFSIPSRGLICQFRESQSEDVDLLENDSGVLRDRGLAAAFPRFPMLHQTLLNRLFFMSDGLLLRGG